MTIGDAMAAGDRKQAKENIDELDAHYQKFIKELLKEETPIMKQKYYF